jgi:hypothetical protein
MRSQALDKKRVYRKIVTHTIIPKVGKKGVCHTLTTNNNAACALLVVVENKRFTR